MAHYSPEPNRLRQKRSLQQFSFLDSEYAVMKAAFFALIVAVLSFQGSEAFLLGGPSVLDDLLKLVNGLLVSIKDAVQRALDSTYPSQNCTVVDVVSGLYKVFTRSSNLSTTMLERI